jgi:hypothetical protein
MLLYAVSACVLIWNHVPKFKPMYTVFIIKQRIKNTVGKS